MHGRIKVKTTAEQQEAKRLEREKKVKLFKAGIKVIFEKRQKKEHDVEALTVTKDFLLQNPDAHTLWNFRREILLDFKAEKTEDELQTLGKEELELTQNSLKNNPKSYWAWHHRFWVLNFMPHPDWAKELKLCDLFLSMDERNFHCWDYRRRICKQSSVEPKDELDFTTNLIEKNFSNYSAWHYRSTLLPLIYPGPGHISVDENILLKEYEMVQNAAFTDPNDQSVWFYHRWLLGRGNKDVNLIKIAVVKEIQIVIVVFSSPIQITKDNKPLLRINETEINELEWQSASDDMASSTVWCCKIPDQHTLNNDPTEVKVKFTNHSAMSELACDVIKQISKNEKISSSSVFCSDISASTRDVLEKELESCEQLLELEPNNKWVIFTTVLLMKSIDSRKYFGGIINNLEKLMDVDVLRKNYYTDLRSKFIIENMIEDMAIDASSVCINNQNLSNLYHFHYFIFVRRMDLSYNDLKSVKAVQYLLCIEALILDNNKLKDCNDIKNLYFLKKLSVCNNVISSISDLSSLETCPRLEYLNIKGNPVMHSEHFKELGTVFSNLQLE